MKAYLLVFVGGGLGSLVRYLAGRLIPPALLGAPFPTAILTVNILASAVLGLISGWITGRSGSDEIRLLIGVGFCGGLSTFSSFSQDTVVLLQAGRLATALINIGLNLIVCLLASVGGFVVGQKI